MRPGAAPACAQVELGRTLPALRRLGLGERGQFGLSRRRDLLRAESGNTLDQSRGNTPGEWKADGALLDLEGCEAGLELGGESAGSEIEWIVPLLHREVDHGLAVQAEPSLTTAPPLSIAWRGGTARPADQAPEQM